jgi:hypothetical protein
MVACVDRISSAVGRRLGGGTRGTEKAILPLFDGKKWFQLLYFNLL